MPHEELELLQMEKSPLKAASVNRAKGPSGSLAEIESASFITSLTVIYYCFKPFISTVFHIASQ